MKFLFFAGILFFIGSLILIYSNYSTLKIEKYGSIVRMQIEDMPTSCLGSRVRYSVKLSYNGKFYDIDTRGNFCKVHYIGELIEIKYWKDSETILWPHKSVKNNLISAGLLGIFGLTISFLQFKKMNSLKKTNK